LNGAITLNAEGLDHCRVKYDLITCFGDVGGLFAAVFPVFYFFLNPMSEHSFTLAAAKQLFFARHNEGKCKAGKHLFDNASCK